MFQDNPGELATRLSKNDNDLKRIERQFEDLKHDLKEFIHVTVHQAIAANERKPETNKDHGVGEKNVSIALNVKTEMQCKFSVNLY